MNIVYFVCFVFLNNNSIYLTFLLESGNVAMFCIYIGTAWNGVQEFQGLYTPWKNAWTSN